MPARKRRAGKRVATQASKAAAGASKPMVSTWEDDPGDPHLQPPLVPISVAVPNQAAQPLPFRISGPTPPPKIYQPGTANFRFYAAASALRRTADFWGSIVPQGTRWEVGARLPVVLDDGVDLNAFYTRGGFGEAPGLHFFHQSVAGRTFFSGESPDAAFHESFGDMSAILSALQVPSFRQAVFNATQGTLNRASRLSRLAEQLGAAIGVDHPDAVDRDCLRNAVNSFFYRDP